MDAFRSLADKTLFRKKLDTSHKLFWIKCSGFVLLKPYQLDSVSHLSNSLHNGAINHSIHLRDLSWRDYVSTSAETISVRRSGIFDAQLWPPK